MPIDAVALLHEYPHITETLIRLNDELNKTVMMKDNASDTLKAVVITGMPKSHELFDPVVNAVQYTIDNFGNHIICLTNRINFLMDAKIRIDNIMYKLRPEEYRIIELRYINGNRWTDIAKIMNYSESNCYEIHKKVMDEVIKKFESLENPCSKV